MLAYKAFGLGKEKFQDTNMQNQNYRKMEQIYIYVRKGKCNLKIHVPFCLKDDCCFPLG